MMMVQTLEVGLLSNDTGLILRYFWAQCKNKFGVPIYVLSWPDNSDIYSNVRIYTKHIFDTESEIHPAFLCTHTAEWNEMAFNCAWITYNHSNNTKKQ